MLRKFTSSELLKAVETLNNHNLVIENIQSKVECEKWINDILQELESETKDFWEWNCVVKCSDNYCESCPFRQCIDVATFKGHCVDFRSCALGFITKKDVGMTRDNIDEETYDKLTHTWRKAIIKIIHAFNEDCFKIIQQCGGMNVHHD